MTSRRAFFDLLVRVAATLVAATLVACAGGGEDGVGSGGTGYASGSVTGFGSVIVEDVRYDDSAAAISVENDPAAPRTGTSTDVRLGMQVEVSFDASERAQTIRVAPTVVGSLESRSSTALVVAGQAVRLASDPQPPAVLSGLSGLADLSVGDRLEVHGTRDASGTVVATRLERLDASSGSWTRVMGPITGLDASGRSFTLGGLTVQLASNASVLPAGAVLAEGQVVAVYADGAPAGGRLVARSVRVVSVPPSDAAPWRIGGVVRSDDRATQRLRVAQAEIDIASASYVNGSASDVAEGSRVRILGVASAGRLRATQIEIVRAVDELVQITGPITDYVASGSFRVRQTPIDASSSAVAWVGASAASLADGVTVTVSGQVSGGVLRASRVQFASAVDARPPPVSVSADGRAYMIDPLSRTFVLNGYPVLWTVATTFDGDPAALRGGVPVTVQGTVVGGTLVATRITLRPGT